MSVRLQDFQFTIKVDKASPDLNLPPSPPPPPPPPPSPQVADGSVTGMAWAAEAASAYDPGLPTLTSIQAGVDILF